LQAIRFRSDLFLRGLSHDRSKDKEQHRDRETPSEKNELVHADAGSRANAGPCRKVARSWSYDFFGNLMLIRFWRRRNLRTDPGGRLVNLKGYAPASVGVIVLIIHTLHDPLYWRSAAMGGVNGRRIKIG
jgi:hypothetical protein